MWIRKVVASMNEQSRLLWHSTNIFLHPKIHEYADKLVAKMPGDLKVGILAVTVLAGEKLGCYVPVNEQPPTSQILKKMKM